MPDKPFMLLTPEYFQDFRQEFYILNHYKEQLYLRIVLVGAVFLFYGLL